LQKKLNSRTQERTWRKEPQKIGEGVIVGDKDEAQFFKASKMIKTPTLL
jgi:hypothetical protein